MVKLVFAVRRRSDMSREACQRYWRDEHGPLVARHAAALRIRRYVQAHTAASALNGALRESRSAPEEFDGTAELWWESEEDLAAAMSSTEGSAAAAALLEDEKRFIDHARSPLWVAEEHVFVDA